MMKINLLYALSLGLLGSIIQAKYTKNSSHKLHLRKQVPRPRIIGGKDAEPHAYPYQTALIIEDLFRTMFCGGSLITPTEVLTAAHCLDGAITVKVLVGAHNLGKIYEEGREVYLSENYTIHDNWDAIHLTNDVAIVKLPEYVKENNYTKTIPIARNKSISYNHKLGVLTGWGLTSDASEKTASILQVLRDDILSNEQCKTFSNLSDIIQDCHICTNGQGRIGSCSGDSGGPLVVDGIQVGIVSFGNEYCERSYPSVYTRVTYYSDWIIQNSSLE